MTQTIDNGEKWWLLLLIFQTHYYYWYYNDEGMRCCEENENEMDVVWRNEIVIWRNWYYDRREMTNTLLWPIQCEIVLCEEMILLLLTDIIIE